jgi:predicted dehydrogenase
MPHVSITRTDELPQDMSRFHVIITAADRGGESTDPTITEFVRRGGGWFCLGHGANRAVPPAFGVRLTRVEPAGELRVMFADTDHPLARRMPASFYVPGPYQSLLPDADDSTVLMYADWHYRHMPVLTARKIDRGLVACTTLQCFDVSCFQQIAYRLLLYLAGGIRPRAAGTRSVGVGILGYAQSVGQLHGSGICTTDGLHLVAACDLNPERRAHAHTDFPDIRLYDSSTDMAGDPDVELVIVATAPNTHASLAVQMMSQGKHVVCEKPLALSRKETDTMLETSVQQKVHLSCHQNRRFDVDYRAIKRAITEGLIGDLFYMETFVGGFSHPCGYWHSHEPVSGGTAYDWGGHYLDWIVSLIPDHITSVTGTSQKRVWHDVTNADQERIHLRFAGGQEAEFMHSDIAAVRKPKWYLLGTKGAIISTWRDVSQYDIDPVLYFREEQIPATEMPPELHAYRYHNSGAIVCQSLAMPRREHFLFYRNLADQLLTGEPLAAPLSDSMKVVAILEAAQQSVRTGQPVEVVND